MNYSSYAHATGFLLVYDGYIMPNWRENGIYLLYSIWFMNTKRRGNVRNLFCVDYVLLDEGHTERFAEHCERTVRRLK